jgi:hypothetical protein
VKYQPPQQGHSAETAATITRLKYRIKRLEEELNDNGLVLQKIQHERDGSNERIKRLEEAGDEMHRYITVTRGLLPESANDWRKAKEAKL